MRRKAVQRTTGDTTPTPGETPEMTEPPTRHASIGSKKGRSGTPQMATEGQENKWRGRLRGHQSKRSMSPSPVKDA